MSYEKILLFTFVTAGCLVMVLVTSIIDIRIKSAKDNETAESKIHQLGVDLSACRKKASIIQWKLKEYEK